MPYNNSNYNKSLNMRRRNNSIHKTALIWAFYMLGVSWIGFTFVEILMMYLNK